MNPDIVTLALQKVSIIGLVGRPGCGKEFTGNALCRRFSSYERIVMSTIIGRECKANSARGMEIKQYLDSGALVPDDIVINLFLSEIVALQQRGIRMIISDGFPRNPHQQDTLHKLGARFSMFFIELPVEKAVERMLERKRAGEDEGKCYERQRVFEECTMPMINHYREHFPHSFRQIDGLKEAEERAIEVHRQVIQMGATLVTAA